MLGSLATNGEQGAGESLRGSLNSAVDRAFGTNEGAEVNEEVARRGEREVQLGEFAPGEAPRRRRKS